MKRIKTFNKFEKINESTKSDLDIYLAKLGTTIDDLKDIFIECVDHGFEIEAKISYRSDDGKWSNTKKFKTCTPELTIHIRNDELNNINMKDIKILECLYHSISMYMSMFSSFKPSFNILGQGYIKIETKFPTETNSDKLSIDDIRGVLKPILDESCEKFNYSIAAAHHSAYGVHFTLNPLSVDELVRDLIEKSDSGDEYPASNYETVGSLIGHITRKLISELSDKLGKDIKVNKRKSDSKIDKIGYIKESGEIEWLFKINSYADDIYSKTISKKVGLFKKINIDVEIYSMVINIDLV